MFSPSTSPIDFISNTHFERYHPSSHPSCLDDCGSPWFAFFLWLLCSNQSNTSVVYIYRVDNATSLYWEHFQLCVGIQLSKLMGPCRHQHPHLLLFPPFNCTGFSSVLQTHQGLCNFRAFAETISPAGPLHNLPFRTFAYTVYPSLFKVVSSSIISWLNTSSWDMYYLSYLRKYCFCFQPSISFLSGKYYRFLSSTYSSFK